MRPNLPAVTARGSKLFCMMHNVVLLVHIYVIVVMITASSAEDPITEAGNKVNLTTKDGINKVEKFLKDSYERGRVRNGRSFNRPGKVVVKRSLNSEFIDDSGRSADKASVNEYIQRLIQRNVQKRRVSGNVWPTALSGAQAIPYAFDPDNPFIDQALSEEKIKAAIRTISDTTCVRFVEVNASFSGDMILFQSSQRCYSFIGHVKGRQAIELVHTTTSTCLIHGIIIHEILHALGHFHEHVREDRDRFIRLYPENIESGFAFNYDITKTTLLASYDYQSVMHYGPKAYALPGTVVFRTIPDGAYDFLTGQRVEISYYDVLTINIAYKCIAESITGTCDSQVDCNKGYALKSATGDCFCKCPSNLGGPTCEDVITDTGCGGVRLLQKIGDAVQLKFESTPGDISRKCVYVVQGPPGSVINLQSTTFDMGLIGRGSRSENSVEIRSNMLGQDGPIYGGRTILEYINTREHFRENAIMLVYKEGDTSVSGPSSAVFVATATDVRDPCLDNPCGPGSNCVPDIENLTYMCRCAPLFIGVNCTQLDPSKVITDDFEDSSVILMVNLREDDFDWTRHIGKTTTFGTGPSSGYDGSSNYMYCEASYPVKNNYKAILSSASDFPLSDGRCISFCLHMYGSSVSMSNFDVVLHYSNGARDVRYSSNQNLGDQWVCEKITIDPRTDGVTVWFAFEYTRRSFKADVAVDHVETWPGSCNEKPEPTCSDPPEVKNAFISEILMNKYHTGHTVTYICFGDFELVGLPNVTCQANGLWSNPPICKRIRFACDFESSAHPLCDFLVQSEEDDLDWIHIRSDTTPTLNTGPSFASNRFGYVYFESSRPAKTGDIASLEANIAELTDGGAACLRLSLSMYGNTMGSFTIMGNNSELMTLSRNSNDWETVAVTVPQGTQKVSFRATRGSSYRSDIAIDNMRITEGACKSDPCDSRPCFHVDDSDYSSSSSTCTCVCPTGLKGDTCDVIDFSSSSSILSGFELSKKNPLGIFKQLRNDSSDLTFRNGRSNSRHTGPASPAEGNTYLYYDGSWPNPPSSTATLETALIQGNIKVDFKYHMFGKNEGKLEIFQREEGGASMTLLGSYEGQSCGRTMVQSECPWSADSFNALEYSEYSPGYRLLFVFTLGDINDFRTDIAVDSVIVSKVT